MQEFKEQCSSVKPSGRPVLSLLLCGEGEVEVEVGPALNPKPNPNLHHRQLLRRNRANQKATATMGAPTTATAMRYSKHCEVKSWLANGLREGRNKSGHTWTLEIETTPTIFSHPPRKTEPQAAQHDWHKGLRLLRGRVGAAAAVGWIWHCHHRRCLPT